MFGMLDLPFMCYFIVLLFLIQRAHACFMGGKLSSTCVPLIQFTLIITEPFFHSIAPTICSLHFT